MRIVERTNQFKRDYKREKKTNNQVEKLLEATVVILISDEELPDRMKDHPLEGEWKGCRDCHLKPDLVLIYKKSPESVMLIRIGSHSELFG